MTRESGILPPKDENENSPKEAPRKKKSFVRVSPSRKPKVIDAEVLDSSGSADAVQTKRGMLRPVEIIEVGNPRGAQNSQPQGEGSRLPVPTKSRDIVPYSERPHGNDKNEGDGESEGERYDQDNLHGGALEETFGASDHEGEYDSYDASTLADEKGLVVSSALQRYLAELRKYPLMTPAEEKEAALKAYEHGDLAARNRLVTANLRLVVKIAMEYRRAYSQILDLIQEGNAGLVQAVNRFDPFRGVKLSTYSAWWIRAYILKFLMDNKSLVRMGTTDAQRKLFFRLRSEAEKMYALTQRFDANLLAESIGVKESDVVEMQQRLTKNDVSLDTPVGENGDRRQIDTLVAEIEEPDVRIEREQVMSLLRKEVHEVEKELNERDAFIFKNRIMAEDPITLQDVGDKFGITRERARQLESRVMKKIKERLLAAGISQ